jgi:hypothetical protein
MERIGLAVTRRLFRRAACASVLIVIVGFPQFPPFQPHKVSAAAARGGSSSRSVGPLDQYSSVVSPVYSAWWTGHTNVTQQWGCVLSALEDPTIPSNYSCNDPLPPGFSRWYWHHGIDLADNSTFANGVGCDANGTGTSLYAGRAGTASKITTAQFQINPDPLNPPSTRTYINVVHEQRVLNDPFTGSPIAQGAQVSVGEPVVMTGNIPVPGFPSTGCHLHFEVDIGNTYLGWYGSGYDVDPTPYIGAGVSSTPCVSGTASATPPTPSSAGTPVTITGSASGCPSRQYEFWYLGQGSSTWQFVRGYSTVATYNWNSTGALAGSHIFSVWIRDGMSAGTTCNPGMGCYDTYGNTTYTITVATCTGPRASAAPASQQVVGNTVTITASASCPNPRYEFWLRPYSGSWTIVQQYSSSNTFYWQTISFNPGTYYYSVWARDSSSTADYDSYVPGTAYVLIPY